MSEFLQKVQKSATIIKMRCYMVMHPFNADPPLISPLNETFKGIL